MAWRCPACSNPIGLGEIDNTPRTGKVYRCNVCRLELVMDEATKRLVIEPVVRARPIRGG
jgi:hypothetical protein